MAEIHALNEDMQSDLREYEADGLALLQLSPEAKPLGIVTRINEHARYLRAEGATLDQDDVLALGILLGWQYVRATAGTGVRSSGTQTPAPLACSTATMPGSSTPCGG